MHVHKVGEVCSGIALVIEFCALKLLSEVGGCHLGVTLVDSFDSVLHVHGVGVCFDTTENLIWHGARDQVHGHIFFGCPLLVRVLAVDDSSIDVGLGCRDGCEVI